ncbi:hypothetical protein R5R35_005517 [Gryllus longicercus]|uniref:Accessory gland protein n=1 Tax=Gryllus longicercus TaxID=2509291 RepID=A0AAN9Z2L5_9ORTH
MASLTLVLFLFSVAASTALPRDISQNLIDSHMKHFEENRQALRLLKAIIDEMNSNIEFVQKRSVCYIGAGMGHNCEYGEALDSAFAARHLLGDDNPGKRGPLPLAPAGAPF